MNQRQRFGLIAAATIWVVLFGVLVPWLVVFGPGAPTISNLGPTMERFLR